MTKAEARRLAAKMVRDDPQVEIVGTRFWGRADSYQINAVDRRNGYSFTVASPQDWAERKDAAEAG
jgi:hypothetical protein